MKVLKCLICGNTEKFSVNCTEYHSYEVDKHKNIGKHISCNESVVNEYFCEKCHSGYEFVKEV